MILAYFFSIRSKRHDMQRLVGNASMHSNGKTCHIATYETMAYNYIHWTQVQTKYQQQFGLATTKSDCLQYAYRVRQKKLPPWRVLKISQQRIRIFARKFTELFLIHIYV